MKIGENAKKFLERKKSLKIVFEYLSKVYEGSPDGSIGIYYVLGLMELKDKLDLCLEHGVDCTTLKEQVNALSEFKDIVIEASNNGTVGILVDEIHKINAVAESFLFFVNREYGGIEKIKDSNFHSVVKEFVDAFKKEGIDVEKEIGYLCGININDGNKLKL